jgi:very-short-patch-repair endonuclease
MSDPGERSIIASLISFNGTKKGQDCKTAEQLVSQWEETKVRKNDTKYLPYFDKYHAKMLTCAMNLDRFLNFDNVFDDAPIGDNKFDFYVSDLKSIKIAFSKHKPTPIERMMGYRLLESGFNFTYQAKIDINGTANGRSYFVCDFVMMDNMIVIETEGKIHCNEENWKKDMSKQNFLTSMGYSLFRFGWDDVMEVRDDYDIVTFITDLIDCQKELKSNDS